MPATTVTHVGSFDASAVSDVLSAAKTAGFGTVASDTVGFFGATPVSQRSSSLQTSSNVVTSASFGTLQVAQIQEILNILNTLGLSKGA
jgi:hypothetical protein